MLSFHHWILTLTPHGNCNVNIDSKFTAEKEKTKRKFTVNKNTKRNINGILGFLAKIVS